MKRRTVFGPDGGGGGGGGGGVGVVAAVTVAGMDVVSAAGVGVADVEGNAFFTGEALRRAGAAARGLMGGRVLIE